MFTAVQSWFDRATSPFSAERYETLAHERLRFYTLLTVGLLKMLNFFGGAWDIQWHVAIGRDNLFIPPHVMVLTAFVSGLAVILAAIAYETYLARSGIKLGHVVKIGALRAPASFIGVYLGYTGAMLSGLFDEAWHRAFGIDATLWSPPHIAIMISTMLVDVSLLVGLAASGRRLGWKLHWRRPMLWGIVLAGAYTLEAVCFQMSEAFIVGYRAGGAGLYGILFPVLVGVLFPLPLLLAVKLSRRFWVAAPIFVATISLQYISLGIAAAGFILLNPVSVIEEFVRLNPDSTIAQARDFAQLAGFTGLIGFKQAWTIWLSAIPLGLVALLHWWRWPRQHLWLAAPVYSISLVLVSSIWFKFTPPLNDYPTTGFDVLLGLLIAAVGGLVFGALGLQLAKLAERSITRNS